MKRGVMRLTTSICAQRSDFSPSLPVTVSVVAPLVVLRLTGQIDWSLYAVFGTLASVHG